jgi:inner membrane protein
VDNLTHTLTGLALSRAGLNRFHPRAALVLMIAANAPDFDIVTLFGGTAWYFESHRGWSHSIVMAPVMALLSALIVCAIGRSVRGWIAAWGIAIVGVASHLLLDWTNAYGIRFFMPFSGAWYRLDLNNLTDLWIWGVLLIAALGPLLGRLVSSEIGGRPSSGRGLAIFALLFLVAYESGRYVIHERALETLNSRVYQGHPPIRVAAFPVGSTNPFAWSGWVEEPTFSVHFKMNLLSDFDPSAGMVVYKPEPSPAIEAAKLTPVFHVFLDFAQFPLWRVVPISDAEGARRVEVSDWRFPFAAVAVVDASNRVVSTRFHY